MTTILDWESLDLTRIVRPGDTVVCVDGPGEPTPLTAKLLEQRRRLGGIRLFMGTSLGTSLKGLGDDPDLRVATYNGGLAYFDLFEKGNLAIVPTHFFQVGREMADGNLKTDVAFLHVAPPDADGNYNLGPSVGYGQRMLENIDRVVAMVNPRLPRMGGDTTVPAARIDYLLRADTPVLELPRREPSATEVAIAEHIAPLVPDRATLQLGIGTLPDAVAGQLIGKKDLGLHSGLLGESIVDLMDSGTVTNRYKEVDTGATVSALYFGSRRLYDFLDGNPNVQTRCASHTHNPAILSQFARLVSINSAIEVDLTGQVNGETIGRRYIGTLGGQGDFQRSAMRTPEGHGIIALPATAAGGKASRIVPRVTTTVTTPRGDADLVITEFGVAELRGRTLEERARAMIEIAHPDHRAALFAALDDLA